MSSSCDSDEFYDAEDITPSRVARRSRSVKSSPFSPKHNSQSENESLPKEEENVPKEEENLPKEQENVSEAEETIPKTECMVSREVKNVIHDVGVETSDNNAVLESDSSSKEKRVSNSHQGRRRFRELRQRMQTEEEDAAASPPDSQTSSVEGVFACPQTGSSSLSGTKVSHPFRIIEHDALSLQSLTSLGRVGRLLAGLPDPTAVGRAEITTASSSSTLGGDLKEEEEEDEDSPVTAHSSTASTTPSAATPLAPAPSALVTATSAPSANAPAAAPLQEPDVIASTKGPVAPPRRKRKAKAQSTTNLAPDKTNDFSQCSPLPSPASTIESLTRELEHSLDIQSATKGQYVVKPQDEDRAKSDGPSSDDLERLKLSSPRGSLGSASARRSGSGGAQMGMISGHGAVGYGGAGHAGGSGKSHGGSGTASSASSNSIGRDLASTGPGSGEAGRGTLSSRSSSSISRQKERRRSAGDEQGLMTQLNMFVRTRTDSGKQLTDMEILEQVTVLNLDTGERVPLSIAEDKLPQCINPLSLHIMRLTSEYVSTGDDSDGQARRRESDEESVDSKRSVPLSVGDAVDEGDETEGESTVRKRTTRLKRFFGSTVKKTMNKAKTIAQEVSHARHKEEVMDILDSAHPNDPPHMKLKASGSHKGPYEFDTLQQVQDLSGEHVGAVWCMKFSCCGRLLATAGQDRVLRVWVIRSAFAYFQEMRTKYNAEKVSPTPSQESLVSQHSAGPVPCDDANDTSGSGPFMPRPFCKYSGHTSDLLDVSWSKNYFLLSSSMDKTVRLWHISRKECLCCFQHIDFVTAIVFHPRDDRYFLSGSLDGKLRLWNIPDKKVAVWSELDGQTKLITAANFFQNGKIACVGTYDGRCIFYNTDQLKYHTQINVRSTRGKNSTGRKISGIEPMPGAEKILVTSNDSRIRLYDLRDLSLSCKYKGYVNVSSQIKASFSHDGKYIVSGSENQCIYIWRTHHDYAKFSSVRRDRNDFWEGIKAHNALVTCAVFAPNPDAIFKQMEETEGKNKGPLPKDPSKLGGSKKGQAAEEIEDPLVAQRTQGCGGHVLVSADFNGCIKVFTNKTKPKHSSLPASALV